MLRTIILRVQSLSVSDYSQCKQYLLSNPDCLSSLLSSSYSWALPDYVNIVCIYYRAGVLIYQQPHNTRWFSPAQRRLAQVRLAEDVGEADEDSSEDS